VNPEFRNENNQCEDRNDDDREADWIGGHEIWG
jgi:hypothetical protein